LKLAPPEADAWFPALSRQVPLPEAAALSGPLYVPEQNAIPDTASVPFTVKATGWLYQPLLSAPLVGPPTATEDGGVPSTLNGAVDAEPVPPPLVTEHAWGELMPSESPPFTQPETEVMPPSGSEIDQVIVTLLYQPLSPAIAPTETVTTGGVMSAALAAGTSARQTKAA
jgi:hypothetical protein